MAEEKDYQQRYYEKNKEKLLKKRRERYEKDEEYREAMRIRDQRRYWFGRRQEKDPDVPDKSLEDIEPLGTIDVDGREVRVYATSAVGELLDRTRQTIAKWGRRGVIPDPYWRGRDVPERIGKGRNPRLYTEDEMRVMAEARHLLALPARTMSESAFSTAVHEGFENLTKGVK